MILMMHLNSIIKRLENEDTDEWVIPQGVIGFDKPEIFEKNKIKWFEEIDDEIERADEIITEYLDYCLSSRSVFIGYRQPVPPALDIDASMLVEAAVYIITQMGSSYAATILGMHRELLTTENASHCIAITEKAYNNSDSFVRDILRNFILDHFRYGPLWEPDNETFINNLDEHSKTFLHTVFEQGYLTI